MGKKATAADKATDVLVSKRKNNVEVTALKPLLLTITDVASVLRMSRTKVYELIALEGLPTVRFGKSVRVSVWSLQTWVEAREKGAQDG